MGLQASVHGEPWGKIHIEMPLRTGTPTAAVVIGRIPIQFVENWPLW